MTPERLAHIEERYNNKYICIHANAKSEIGELIAYVRELEKDKARLDWLETHSANLEMQKGDDGQLYVRGNYMCGNGNTLRDAIDNAKEGE
jgi:hypothetical protein